MAWLFLAALAVMVALALRTPLDHDEGQYIAAADLVAKGLLPYRDFPYLQTPLQPLLFAPLAWIAPGWLLVASRLANSLCVAIAIFLTGRTAAALAQDERAGMLAMLLALVTDPLLLAGSVARNDALPLLLLCLALERLYTVRDRLRPGRGFLVGVACAAAASAKISYALPAAAMCAQAMWRARAPEHRPAMLAILAGSLVGALPVLYFALLAPRPFLFQVYSYSLVAVRAWAAIKGQAWRLSPPVRVAEWTGGMLQGPLLAILVAGGVLRWRTTKPQAGARPPISLGPVVAATVLASILPMPALRQYLVPLAAPLTPWFIALAWPKRPWRLSRRAMVLVGLLAFAGIGRSAWILASPDGDEAPFRVEREAHFIGRIARQIGASSIATLEPVHAIDSGIGVDPRFATGHFLFRAGNVAACADPALCPVTSSSIARLDRRPPDMIVTGTQHKQPSSIVGGLDGLLDRWSSSHRYRAVRINRKNLLWLNCGVATATRCGPIDTGTGHQAGHWRRGTELAKGCGCGSLMSSSRSRVAAPPLWFPQLGTANS